MRPGQEKIGRCLFICFVAMRYAEVAKEVMDVEVAIDAGVWRI